MILLGRFRVERGGVPIPDSAWSHPKAKRLLKLLAIQAEGRQVMLARAVADELAEVAHV